MIRLSISAVDLRAAITKLQPKWFTRAEERAIATAAKGTVGDGDGIWSEIKSIYMEYQGFKCMYCEKPMPKEAPGGTAEGKVEYDVEHFRPKNRVTKWPTQEVKTKRLIDYDGQLRQGDADGYLRLAFDPWNYGVSCKTCNSELKSDRFPIVGKSNAKLKTRKALDKSEVPCLILPIGDEGEDPEAWLEWMGPMVRPRSTLDAQTMLRAKTLVDFFELDTRADLISLRCQLVSLLCTKLESMALPPPDGPDAKQFVDAVTEPTRPFAACGRAFVRLFAADPPAAKRWRKLADDFIMRQDPAVFKS